VPPYVHAHLSDLRTEVDDINLGLEHFFGDFNVIHARLIASGVSVHDVQLRRGCVSTTALSDDGLHDSH
jgi:hypothetical protein